MALRLLGIFAVLLAAGVKGQDVSCDVDVLFMIDFTQSMAVDRYDWALDTIQSVVDDSVVSANNVQYGILYFGTGEAQLVYGLPFNETRNQQQVTDYITYLRGLIPSDDGPTTQTALAAMRADLTGSGPRFGVLFTDSPSDNHDGAVDEADAARADGITILGVGLGNDLPSQQLNQIAGGNENTVYIRNAGDEVAAAQKIKDDICPDTPTPETPVTLSCDADVMLVVDYTDSMSDIMDDVLNSIERIVSISNITAGAIQYGLMIIGQQADQIEVRLPLNGSQVTTRQDVLDAINDLRNLDPTWDGPAFDLTIEEVILQLNASRNGGDNRDVALIFTDSPVGNPAQLTPIASEARDIYNIEFIAVGIGQDSSDLELLLITDLTANTFHVDAASELESIELELTNRICRVGDTPACQFLDVAFVLDASGSIADTPDWNRTIDFAMNFVENFRVGDEFLNFGVVYFKTQATLHFNVTQFDNKADILNSLNALRGIEDGGDTNIADGLKVLREDVFTNDQRNAPRIGMLITDGSSKVNTDQTPVEARLAREAGINLFAIGVGSSINLNELQNITAESGDDQKVFLIDNFEELLDEMDEIINNVCPNCTNPGDWVVILDSSGSVGEANFNLEKFFVERLITEATIDDGTGDGEGAIRLGLMKFGDNGDIQWHLNQYTTSADLLTALLRVRYTGGTTNTGDALRRAREEMFTTANGDRPSERNTILLFTDGGSTNFANTLEEARLTRLSGITVLVVAVTNWVNWKEINEIASDPDDRNTFSVETFDTMFERAFTDVRSAACNDINECLPNPCLNGGSCVDDINTFYCNCLVGFAGERCQFACPDQSDVAFVVDSSGSITNYYDVQECFKQLARGLNVNVQHRIGLVNFNDATVKRFGLSAYNTSKEVVDAISFPWMDGQTDSAEALRVTRTETLGSDDERPDGFRTTSVFASDGHSSDAAATFTEAALTHEAGITVLTVESKNNGVWSERELDGIASDEDDGNQWQHVETCAYVESIVQQICNDEDNCDPNPCNDSLCVDYINSYDCICGAERSGKHCDLGCSGVLDLGILLDVSGSIREDRFRNDVIPFLNNVIDELEIRENKTQVGLVIFDYDLDSATDRTAVQFTMGQYKRKEDIKHAIRTLPYYGGRTNTADGLRMARTLFTDSRDGVFNLLLVVTDGQSNIQPENTIPEAVLTRQAGMHIVVATVENDPNNLEIKGIASRPHAANIFNAARYSNLPDIVASIVQAGCDDENECLDQNRCSGSGQCMDMLGSYFCDCDANTAGKDCQISPCTSIADIGFILDASGSVEEFELEQDLLYAVAQGLNFKGTGMRAGVITYQVDATIQVPLERENSLMGFLNSLGGFTRNIGIDGTDTSAALDLARDTFFPNGDRLGADNVVLLMTDGRSNRNQANTIPAADDLRQDGARVLVVAVGDNVNMGEINGLADDNSDNVFLLPNASAIDSVASDINNFLCTL